MRGNVIKKRLQSFAFEKTPRISLGCKLVPVQYRESGVLEGFLRGPLRCLGCLFGPPSSPPACMVMKKIDQ